MPPDTSVISSQKLIADTLHLLGQTLATPVVAAAPLSTTLPARNTSRPCALLLSPHPDDECLAGLLPLRLKSEQNWQIINVAVTLGSNLERRNERKRELAKACAVLDFDCVLSEQDGFSTITETSEDLDQITRLAQLIAQTQPQAVFLPHAHDAHPTHSGTHRMGMLALAAQGPQFNCSVVQTEYWQPQVEPNLMIGASESDAATLLTALTCHAGEVMRNPYHLRLPAFLIDNVRRGSERIGGKGKASALMDFAMLYRFGLWKQEKFIPSALHRIVAPHESVSFLFE